MTAGYVCAFCDDTGWTTVDFDAHGLTYTGLRPCRCSAGKSTGEIHRRIIAANNAEFARLGIAVDPRPRQTRPNALKRRL